MEIQVKKWGELSRDELYACLDLRIKVFVVEQHCAYQEADGHDQNSQHILGYENGKLVAYARLVAPGEIYDEPSIGRVAVDKDHRDKGYGRKLFAEAVEKTRKQYPGQTLKIQAQTYLEVFYQSFGFKTISEPYPDFGVWHVDMTLEP